MCACPVPAETRERSGLVFGQVPADLHVPRVAGLQRRRLGDPGRTMGRGAGWGLELGSAVRTEQRVAVAPRRHHARCGALPSQLLQGERNRPRDLKPDLLAASSRGPGGFRGAGNSRAIGCLWVATRYRSTGYEVPKNDRSVLRSQLLEVLDPEAVASASVALVSVGAARGWRWERTGEEGLREDGLDLGWRDCQGPVRFWVSHSLGVGVGPELPRKWLLILLPG